jgi:hypothetical protein
MTWISHSVSLMQPHSLSIKYNIRDEIVTAYGRPLHVDYTNRVI